MIFFILSLLAQTSQASQTSFITDGWSSSSASFVGNFTSQLQFFIDSNFDPVTEDDYVSTSLVNGENLLRKLTLYGTYLVDVPLNLPSLFVLELSDNAKIFPAENLTLTGSARFAAMVQLNNTYFSAVTGGTIDGTSIPTTDPDKGYMAISITGGSKNAVRNVRALANNSFSVIGINDSPHAEVADSVVGGSPSLGMLSTRCIWTLSTSHALVHDNHVSFCSMHALDFDAYTSSSVAWSNLCEYNGQEGIFLEETADHCVLFNNTCRENENGISIYSNEVGPVTSNFILQNSITKNKRNGLSSGGLAKDDVHTSLQNVFAKNYVSGNAYDQSDTPWGPAPKAQVNPAHGAVEFDYWTGNIIEGDLRYEEGSEVGDADLLSIFEPEIF
ncbi:hypothetical protein TL16_g01501 [Triparma laevis f. inornata]|uniref:Periplasmic copper-binding protein NosD beta helix domain-containing protein n=2 Tax=Triparma laevis TaxID=1534972 RepID=A0A9W7KYM8_9STRA|nr:hypothetical protein TL16_g01501 [Triparma laevis f. inornata]GMI16697.1 hypothetical protein TrLO_g10858 [Triparma laevis f. longispina]